MFSAACSETTLLEGAAGGCHRAAPIPRGLLFQKEKKEKKKRKKEENRLIITVRNRHGFGPALKHYKGKARRYRIFNLSSSGCDSAAIERSEPVGPGAQGTPGSALSDSPV